MKIYLVGGAIRDQLLGLAVKERDYVVVGAIVEEMLALGFRQVGKDFPVFLHPETQEEYALARVERKIGRGYTGFAFDTSPKVTLEEDLLRRDLTINAMAQEINQQGALIGKLIDPYGGEKDLKQHILRHVSNAFAEDPVRILRVGRFEARFAELGFQVAPETVELMREMVKTGEVDALVPERVWKELQRALTEKNPEKFFDVLKSCDALHKLFPGITDQSMQSLKKACHLSIDSMIRFAALLSSLTPSEKKYICEHYRIPTGYAELAYLLTTPPVNFTSKEILALLYSVDAFRRESRFEKFLLASSASYKNYPVTLLKTCFDAAKAVDIKEITDSGAKGKDIAEQIVKKREEIITKLLS